MTYPVTRERVGPFIHVKCHNCGNEWNEHPNDPQTCACNKP